MDSKHGHKVIASFKVPSIGILVTISNVKLGFKSGMILKSVLKNLYWEIEKRVIHFDTDIRFEGETETFVHLNIRDVSEFSLVKEKANKYFDYIIKPIGHQEKPKVDDFLVFSSTIARPEKMKILKIIDDYLLLKTENGTGILNKKYVTRRETAQIGDYVRHCEHMFHDLVDENDNFIFRNKK